MKGKVAGVSLKEGFKSLLHCGEGVERSETDEGTFVLYKVEIKRFKLNFSSIGKWDLQELF